MNFHSCTSPVQLKHHPQLMGHALNNLSREYLSEVIRVWFKCISLVSGFTLYRTTCVTSRHVAWIIVVGVVYRFAFQPPSQVGLAHIFHPLFSFPTCRIANQTILWLTFLPVLYLYSFLNCRGKACQ